MRMLRWIRNEHVRGSVAPVTKKITDKRLKGHVLRRMLDAPVPGKIRKGCQKTRWKDSCKRDKESVGLKEEDAVNRTKWKNDCQYHFGDPRWWGKPDEKKGYVYPYIEWLRTMSMTMRRTCLRCFVVRFWNMSQPSSCISLKATAKWWLSSTESSLYMTARSEPVRYDEHYRYIYTTIAALSPKSVLKIWRNSTRVLPIRQRSSRKFFYAYILPIRYLCATAFCICPLFFTTKNHKKKHNCGEYIGVIDQVRSANDDPNALLQINR